MNPNHKATFALTAAALFLASCSKGGETEGAHAAADESQSKIKCLGVNECKGQGQCGGPAGNACAGQNECKGKGWLLLDSSECAAKGGQKYEG